MPRIVAVGQQAQVAQHFRRRRVVQPGQLQLQAQRRGGGVGQRRLQFAAVQADVAGQRQPAAVQAGGQRRLRQAAAKFGLALQVAVQPERRQQAELRRVDVQLQRVVGAADGAGRLQAVGAGGEGDVGIADLRPGGDDPAVAAERLAGEAAVGDVEPGFDRRAVGQPAPGGETGVDVGGRQAGEAGRVEVLQLSLGAEAASGAEVGLAGGGQARLASGQFELRQAQRRLAVGGVGAQAEARVAEIEPDALRFRTDFGAQRAAERGWPQRAGERGGVEGADCQVDRQLSALPATAAAQATVAAEAGVEIGELQCLLVAGQAAAQPGQRQALAVERAGQAIAHLEAAAQAVALRFGVEVDIQRGARRTGRPGGRVDAGEGDAGAVEGRCGKRSQRRFGAALQAAGGGGGQRQRGERAVGAQRDL